MTKFAICSTNHWDNVLTASERLDFDTYYTKVALSFSVIPESPSETYNLDVLEDLTVGGDGMGGIINTPADLNGQSINLNGNGFTVADAYNGSTFNIKHSNGTLNVHSCVINKTVTTTSSNRYLLFFRDYGTGDTNLYNNRYNMNNSLFGVARIHQHNTGSINIFANIFEDSTITATDCINSSSGGDGAYNVVNNNFINIVDVANGSASGSQIAFRNNYLDYSGTGLTGNCLNDGGNVPSSTVSLVDAFEDTIGYVPKEALKIGVAPSLAGFNQYANGPTISSPYYVGANGIANVTQRNSRINFRTRQRRVIRTLIT